MVVMAPPKKTGRGKAGDTPKQVFEPQWVHFQIQDEELWNQLQKMVKAHQGGVSAFMRWLISREWARRATGPLSLPAGQAIPDAEARQRNGAHWVGKRDDVFEFDEEHAKNLLDEVKGEGKEEDAR